MRKTKEKMYEEVVKIPFVESKHMKKEDPNNVVIEKNLH